MNRYIAFLRAVNVGGSGKLPMAELRQMCESLGFSDVKTYIASGNLVLSVDATKKQVQESLELRLDEYAGKPVGVVMRTVRELKALYENNPYSDKKPNFTAAILLNNKPPKNALSEVSGLNGELLAIGSKEIYAHYPKGMGQSKLKIAASKLGTARNMNTIKKMIELGSE